MSHDSIGRRAALRRLGVGVVAAPAVLRGRYSLFDRPGADSPSQEHSSQEYSARAVRLVAESPVVDMLCQFRFADMRVEGPTLFDRWMSDPTAFTEEHFAAYRDSGVNVLALGRGAPTREEALRFMAEWNGFIASHSEWFTRIDDPSDLAGATESGKVGIMVTFQNSDHLESVDDVDLFHGLGQRVSQVTYNFQNRYGSGFLENRDGGLSVQGHRLVERMQEVGMVVDLSHCADRTTMDGLDAATRPVIFTHASCRALLPGFMRCKTDDAIRKLADGGGVMGIPFIRFMIKAGPPVSVEDVVDHFDHVAQLVGVEHVGIGSDLDIDGFGSPRTVDDGTRGPMTQPNIERYNAYFTDEGNAHIEGLNHPKRAYDLTDALIRRGYGDNDIGLMLGGNFVRVLSDLWA
jgi:membrane dipeptidase